MTVQAAGGVQDRGIASNAAKDRKFLNVLKLKRIFLKKGGNMSNEKLKDALKAELIKKMETDATPEDNVEVSDGDLDGVAGGCGLLLTCGHYTEKPQEQKPPTE